MDGDGPLGAARDPERPDAPGFAAVMLEAPAEKAALDGAVLEILVGVMVARVPVDRRRRDAGEDRSRAEGSGMIVPSSGVKVLIAMKPVDFRKGMDGLAAVVHETLGANPFGGVIYVFRSKRADRVKLLFWDGTGLVLATKRLEQGSFRWPSLREGVMRLTPGQLVALLEAWIGRGCVGCEYPRRDGGFVIGCYIFQVDSDPIPEADSQ